MHANRSTYAVRICFRRVLEAWHTVHSKCDRTQPVGQYLQQGAHKPAGKLRILQAVLLASYLGSTRLEKWSISRRRDEVKGFTRIEESCCCSRVEPSKRNDGTDGGRTPLGHCIRDDMSHALRIRAFLLCTASLKHLAPRWLVCLSRDQGWSRCSCCSWLCDQRHRVVRHGQSGHWIDTERTSAHSQSLLSDRGH